MRRTECAACGPHGALEAILDLGETPIADAYPADATEPEQTYPLQLGVCGRCWLVQLLHVLPADVVFGGDYHFYASSAFPKVAYHERLARALLTRHGDLAHRLTVEVGCNDGDLLRHFAAAGCRTVGVDPAIGPAEVAHGERGLDVHLAHFGMEVAEGLRGVYGRAGLLIANHVVAHVADLDGFLKGITHLLAADGVAVVEVQYLADMLVGNAFDLVYHEHLYHWSLTSLQAVCARHGLTVAGAELTEPQGGSLRVTLTRRPAPTGGGVADLLHAERWLADMCAYRSLQGRAERIRDRLLTLLDEQRDGGWRIAGYAATAKGSTLLNWCGIGTRYLDHVVDTTPTKQGKLMPGVHVPIVAPGARPAPDRYLMLAWNYLPDVLRREHAWVGRGGRFIVPIPVPVLL